jgi:hypothetical protein
VKEVLLGLHFARSWGSPRPGARLPAGGSVGRGGAARRGTGSGAFKGTREQEHGRRGSARRRGRPGSDRTAPGKEDIRRRDVRSAVRGGARRSRRLGAGAALGRREGGPREGASRHGRRDGGRRARGGAGARRRYLARGGLLEFKLALLEIVFLQIFE